MITMEKDTYSEEQRWLNMIKEDVSMVEAAINDQDITICDLRYGMQKTTKLNAQFGEALTMHVQWEQKGPAVRRGKASGQDMNVKHLRYERDRSGCLSQR